MRHQHDQYVLEDQVNLYYGDNLNHQVQLIFYYLQISNNEDLNNNIYFTFNNNKIILNLQKALNVHQLVHKQHQFL
jgi:hypothetical protein